MTGPVRARKRPVVVEAMQFTGANIADVVDWVGSDAEIVHGDLFIHTLEGDHRAQPGDWIIRGVEREHYPCKPSIFEATYVVVDDTDWVVMGARLRAARERAGLTQGAGGVSVATWRKVEKGVDPPYRRSTLVALARAVGWPDDAFDRMAEEWPS